MLRTAIGIALLLTVGLVPAYSEAPSGQERAQTPSTVVPDKRPDSSVPSSGVIQPAPDTSRDATVRPPNVDPGMAISPPGTPGGDPKVDPK
jgi:hypothetical protein